jgi:hypothetical protein
MIRKITVSNTTYISPLRMDGPIVTPLGVPENIVYDMVRKGYKVYDHTFGSPILLTYYNMRNPAESMKFTKKISDQVRAQEAVKRVNEIIKEEKELATANSAITIDAKDTVVDLGTVVTFDGANSVEIVTAPDEESISPILKVDTPVEINPDAKYTHSEDEFYTNPEEVSTEELVENDESVSEEEASTQEVQSEQNPQRNKKKKRRH